MWYVRDKSQTLGRGARDISQVLHETRPSAVTATMTDTSSSDPATRRMGTVMAHGTLKAKTCQKFVDSWHPKYFSQIMLFVIPYMVSGPDRHSTIEI